MKKLLSLLVCGLLLFGCSDKYDDSALRNDLNDLENRVAKLEELCKQMNTNISSLQKIVDALQDNLSISKVEQISDGYIIYFSDGSTATIKNGKDSGTIPIIGVKQDTDGIYYWTLDGEWLTDEKGNKVKAQGTDGTDGKDGVDGEDGNDGIDGEDGVDGTNGKDGKDGITPQLKIESGRWMLSMDNGKTWTDIGQATGADGTDGEDGVDGKDGTNGIFKSVREDDDNVYFTLEDDSVITIPKSDNSKFAIVFDTTDIAILNGGESKTIFYTITDATENTIVKAIAQDGWKVKVDAASMDKGAITITAPNPIVESEILVFANDGSYRTVMVSLNCMQGQINIADNSIDATPAGGTQEIKLTTNLDYTVEIPDDAKSWLSLAPQTRALREDTIVFEVTANEGIQRYATVALKDEQDNTLQTIIFRQLGTCTEVHVEAKGELENVLADYDYANIESLKITGVLNDVDFLFIYRMMPNLKDLDISEVNITTLPTQAFYNSKNVENLTLPNTLTIIGKETFYQSALKHVEIPVGVTKIEESAFYRCYSLLSIKIPASVETIEPKCFMECSKLEHVEFEHGSALKNIAGGINDKDKPSIHPQGAFAHCSHLISIEIPASVEIIEPTAFYGCDRLRYVSFEKPSTLKKIGGGYYPSRSSYYYAGAFAECGSLLSIEIPASVESIETTAFYKCNELTSVTFEEGANLSVITGGHFSYSSSNKNYYCYVGAFAGCPITSIIIPASVHTIEESAFINCSKLTNILFEEHSNLKKIGGVYDNSIYFGAFRKCPISSISLPASVKNIECGAFQDCSNLTSVIFENRINLPLISKASFQNCTSLKSIQIPQSTLEIEGSAFAGCTSLISVIFEDNAQLNRIGYGAFVGTNLNSIKLPSYIQRIENSAFYNITSLITVDASLSTQLEVIGDSAFSGDSELRLFKIGTEIPPTCGTTAFNNINPYSVLKVPSGYADTYKAASGWNNFASITGLDE